MGHTRNGLGGIPGIVGPWMSGSSSAAMPLPSQPAAAGPSAMAALPQQPPVVQSQARLPAPSYQQALGSAPPPPGAQAVRPAPPVRSVQPVRPSPQHAAAPAVRPGASQVHHASRTRNRAFGLFGPH